MSTDQSRVVSRAFTSRLREVLTARLPQDPRWVVWADGVVEELAGCGVEDPRLTQIRALCDTEAERYGYVRTEALRAVLDAVAHPVGISAEEGADRILALVRPVEGVTDPEYGWTAREWRDWSLKLSALLPEEWDGDEDELSIIESFVKHAAEGVVLSPEEARTVIEGITLAAEVTRQWHHLIATPLSAVMTKMQDDLDALAPRLEARS